MQVILRNVVHVPRHRRNNSDKHLAACATGNQRFWVSSSLPLQDNSKTQKKWRDQETWAFSTDLHHQHLHRFFFHFYLNISILSEFNFVWIFQILSDNRFFFSILSEIQSKESFTTNPLALISVQKFWNCYCPDYLLRDPDKVDREPSSLKMSGNSINLDSGVPWSALSLFCFPVHKMVIRHHPIYFKEMWASQKVIYTALCKLKRSTKSYS